MVNKVNEVHGILMKFIGILMRFIVIHNTNTPPAHILFTIMGGQETKVSFGVA